MYYIIYFISNISSGTILVWMRTHEDLCVFWPQSLQLWSSVVLKNLRQMGTVGAVGLAEKLK